MADPDSLLEECLSYQFSQFSAPVTSKRWYKMDFGVTDTSSFTADISSALFQKFRSKVYSLRVFGA